MELQQTIDLTLPLVQAKKKHKYYDHVVKLSATYYRPMITGHKAEHLIQRFNLREDEAAYQQRLRLTQIITPSVCNTLLGPVRKVPKVKPVVDSIEFTEDDEAREKELREAMGRFWSGRSVDAYMGSILLDQGAIDPNAFCLVLFDRFDARYEKPRLYPSIVGCEDAWNFEYANGELRWLLVHRNIRYPVRVKRKGRVPEGQPKEEITEVDGHAWWMYTAQYQVMFVQRAKESIGATTIGRLMTADGAEQNNPRTDVRDTYFFRADSETLYEVSFYEHKAGVVQAFRLGFVPDHTTRGETMVSFINPATPYLLKGIKAGSELDLSAALHAFLQKIQYANPCKGYNGPDGYIHCNGGWEPSGERKCKACNGTGYDTHGSGQDHITFRLPRTKEEFFDLEQIVKYVSLPVDVLQWQDGYVTKLEQACYRSVYNSDRFRSSEVAQTATGDIIDLQSVYDALRPVADWYSYTRTLIYRLGASFIIGSEPAKTVTILHEFPRNMRFETLSERVRLMKEMRDAGASLASVAQVNMDMLRDLYVDDPASLKKAQVQASFDPFLGKAEQTIVSMISQDLTTKEAKVLWTNWNYVFAEAEQRTDEGVSFYDMARSAQEEIVNLIIQELIAEMEAPAAQAERMGLGLADEEDADATAAEEAAESPEVEAAEEAAVAAAEAGTAAEPDVDEMPRSPGEAVTQ